jgi:glyoxylase-like metal-dependent hydrolase (beta-lactamase superfamily II)
MVTVPAMTAQPLDLLHLGDPRRIGAYLLETDDGLALFDCGPASCVPALRVALADRGVELRDVQHLLLSHIHLDHAGAAGVLVREHPGLTVHVSEVGLPHLVDPSRLETSARRLYGEAFDELWGELAPVPVENVRAVGETVVGLACFPTVGHASHHVSFLHEDDLEAWERTLDELGRREARRLALIHFGVFEDVEEHLERLRRTMHEWGARVAHGMDEATFVAAARADVAAAEPGEAEAYDRAAPYWHCYLGLERYWRTRAETAES